MRMKNLFGESVRKRARIKDEEGEKGTQTNFGSIQDRRGVEKLVGV